MKETGKLYWRVWVGRGLLKEYLSCSRPEAYICTLFPGASSLEWGVCGVRKNPPALAPRLGFNSWLRCLLAVWVWSSYLNSLSFSFLVCEIRVVNTFLVSYLWGLNEIMYSAPRALCRLARGFHFLSSLSLQWPLLSVVTCGLLRHRSGFSRAILVPSALHSFLSRFLFFFLLMIIQWQSPHGKADSCSMLFFSSPRVKAEVFPFGEEACPNC